MSSEPSEPPAAPEEGAPAPSEQPNASESELIRQKLVAAIEGGADLRDKATRVRVCHEIEADLKVPYGNVTKQVNAALKAAAQAAGQPTESVTRQVGGAKVKVRIPPEVPAPSAPEQPSEPAGGTETPAPAAAPAPSKPKMSDVFRACKDEKELHETSEYKWLHVQVNTGVTFIDGLYKQIGIVEADKGIMSNAPPGVDMVDLTVQMCMKYDWNVPDRLEKMVFFGAWGALLVLPALAKFGILDDIKNGKLGKKKDPKKSDEPLTKTEPKV